MRKTYSKPAVEDLGGMAMLTRGGGGKGKDNGLGANDGKGTVGS